MAAAFSSSSWSLIGNRPHHLVWICSLSSSKSSNAFSTCEYSITGWRIRRWRYLRPITQERWYAPVQVLAKGLQGAVQQVNVYGCFKGDALLHAIGQQHLSNSDACNGIWWPFTTVTEEYTGGQVRDEETRGPAVLGRPVREDDSLPYVTYLRSDRSYLRTSNCNHYIKRKECSEPLQHISERR